MKRIQILGGITRYFPVLRGGWGMTFTVIQKMGIVRKRPANTKGPGFTRPFFRSFCILSVWLLHLVCVSQPYSPPRFS